MTEVMRMLDLCHKRELAEADTFIPQRRISEILKARRRFSAERKPLATAKLWQESNPINTISISFSVEIAID